MAILDPDLLISEHSSVVDVVVVVGVQVVEVYPLKLLCVTMVVFLITRMHVRMTVNHLS